jgi:hypothetical protein
MTYPGLFLAASLATLVGCQNKPVRHIAEPPVLEVKPKGEVIMKGDSQVQPKVDIKSSEATITLPEGSTFDFNEKLGVIRLTLSKASQMALNRTETAIEGPKSFTPDKAPTIQEEKRAESDFWTDIGMKIGMVLGGSIALFGLVRGWDMVMLGGAAISGASMAGIFLSRNPWLFLLIGGGLALSVAGPYLWHTKLKTLNTKDQ